MSLGSVLHDIGQGVLFPVKEGGKIFNPIGEHAAKDVGLGSKITASKLWTDAGGPAGQKQVAAAVAKAESSCNNKAANYCCHCLWQINVLAHPQYDKDKLKSSPRYCAKAAVEIWKGSGWGAWETYTEGTYKQYLGQDCSLDSPIETVQPAAPHIITDPLVALASFLSLLTQASTWFRIGKVLLGALLLLIVGALLIKG